MSKRSDAFADDNGNLVERLCWFLLVGENELSGSGFSVAVSFNVFDDP